MDMEALREHIKHVNFKNQIAIKDPLLLVCPCCRVSTSSNKCTCNKDAIGCKATLKGHLSVEWRYIVSLRLTGEAEHEGRGFQTLR